MARLSQFNDFIRDVKADAVLPHLAGAILRLYSGAMPANGNAAPSGTMLVEFEPLDDPAGVSAAGVITITPPPMAEAVAAGDASVGALFKAGGQHLANVNVGAADGGGFVIELDDPTIEVNGEVTIQTFSWTEPATGA